MADDRGNGGHDGAQEHGGGDMRNSNDDGGREDDARGSNGAGGGVIGSAALRPVFLGNLKPEYSIARVEELFSVPIAPPNSTRSYQPIAVDRVDIKRGFCFVFLKDAASQEEKDQVEAFVAEINGMELDQVSSSLRVEFARGDGRIRRKEDDRRRNISPSETLFVVNFHEETTKQEDLQMLFEPFGELLRVDMKRNYAFVQFRTVEEATRALEATNGGKLDQSVLSVEYVARRRNDRGGGGGGRRSYDSRGGGDRRGYDRHRGPPGDRYRGGPPPYSRGYGGGYDRDGRDYRDRDLPGGGRDNRHDPYPPRGGGPPSRDDYRPRERERSPPGYRDDHRSRDVGYRGGGEPGVSGGYPRERSRSRSPIPPRGPSGYRSRSPARRYDDRYDGGRSQDYGRDRRDIPAQNLPQDGYRDRRSPERGGDRGSDRPVYRGREERGYRN